jgi:hypothetical protein
MKVRLTKKLAEHLDAVDVSDRHEGDLLDLSAHDAAMLLEERWAIPERRERALRCQGDDRRAADHPQSEPRVENRPAQRPSSGG